MRRALLLSLLFAVSASAQTFRYRTGVFDGDAGFEEYTLTRAEDGSRKLVAHFEMSDRGTAMPLDAELTTTADFTPVRFTIKGKPDRFGELDRDVAVPAGKFALAGFRPASVLMMLIRYWSAHGEPSSIELLPRGRLTVARAGTDLGLTRYQVDGIGSNAATVWLDADQQLAAAYVDAVGVTGTQVVRTDLIPHHALFVQRSEEAALATLRRMDVRPRAEGTIAIAGARVVDVERGTVLDGATVVVRDGKIVAVGKGAKVPRGATRIDGRGKTVLPGLWDMHAHVEEIAWMPRYLAAGVTTVRDVGNKPSFELALRDAIRKRDVFGPRMLLAGIIDGEGPNAVGPTRVKNADEARAAVGRYKELGFDQIKTYNSVSLDSLRAITAEAHRLGMTVTGHIPSGLTIRQALDAGLDMVNHVTFLARDVYPAEEIQKRRGTVALWQDLDLAKLDAVAAMLKKRGTVYDPTLALYELITRPLDEPLTAIEPEAARLPAAVAEETATGIPSDRAEAARAAFGKLSAAVKTLHDAGVTIVAGTDIAVPGFGLWRELELYVRNGFTPMEALQSATLVPSRVMKRDGTIAVGKRADLIVVDGDPTKNISDIRKTEMVMTEGRLYDTASFWSAAGYGARQ